jgi:hypothetical protein
MHFVSSLFLSQVSSASRQPGEQVYALVYISDLQLSGWVEAVVIGEEAMPGTVSIFLWQSALAETNKYLDYVDRR